MTKQAGVVVLAALVLGALSLEGRARAGEGYTYDWVGPYGCQYTINHTANGGPTVYGWVDPCGNVTPVHHHVLREPVQYGWLDVYGNSVQDQGCSTCQQDGYGWVNACGQVCGSGCCGCAQPTDCPCCHGGCGE